MNAGPRRLELESAAADVYSDLRLAPLLRGLLARSTDLVGAAAGSISLVDESRDRYIKTAETGAPCRLGHSFPLDEGVTGEVVARRAPVVLDSYSDVGRGHLSAAHPAASGAVAAIPIWWCGRVIGANVVFAGEPRTFSVHEVDELELLTQLAAAGIVHASAGDPSLSRLIRERHRPDPHIPAAQTVVTEVGPARALSPTVTQVALDLVGLAERAAAGRQPATPLHVALVHRPDGLRLLVHDAAGPRPGPTVSSPVASLGWQELVDTAGGGVSVEHVPGWGTLVRADLPYERPTVELGGVPAPFTPREQEVLGLLAEGASDKRVARELLISPKTVQKHVGAVLRKTGSSSRTAAVMTALEHGWLAHPI